MSLQFTCRLQGEIKLISNESVVISGWTFSVINTPRDCDDLQPYIFVGANHKNAVLSIHKRQLKEK